MKISKSIIIFLLSGEFLLSASKLAVPITKYHAWIIGILLFLLGIFTLFKNKNEDIKED